MNTSTSSGRASGEVNFKEFSCWECKKSPENSEYLKTLVLHGFPTSPPIFECPQCYLQKQDPLSPVVSWIVPPRVLTSNQVYNGKLEEKDRKLVGEGKAVVQVRCMKLDSRTKYMMRFPDKCQVSIAGVKVKAFQPLEQSISTKFRRDEKVDFDHPLLQKADSIAFSISYENVYDDNGKNTLRSDKPVYIFAVALVRRASPKDVLELITKEHSIGQEQFNRIVRSNFELGDQTERNLQLEEVKVVNRCPITHKKIIYPGRVASSHQGAWCTHLQPFCLQSLLSVIVQSSVKNWTCPICKVPCHHLLFDSFMKKVFEEVSALDKDTCFFKEDGSYSCEVLVPQKPRQPVLQKELFLSSAVEVGAEDVDINATSFEVFVDPQTAHNRDPEATLSALLRFLDESGSESTLHVVVKKFADYFGLSPEELEAVKQAELSDEQTS